MPVIEVLIVEDNKTDHDTVESTVRAIWDFLGKRDDPDWPLSVQWIKGRAELEAYLLSNVNEQSLLMLICDVFLPTSVDITDLLLVLASNEHTPNRKYPLIVFTYPLIVFTAIPEATRMLSPYQQTRPDFFVIHKIFRESDGKTPRRRLREAVRKSLEHLMQEGAA